MLEGVRECATKRTQNKKRNRKLQGQRRSEGGGFLDNCTRECESCRSPTGVYCSDKRRRILTDLACCRVVLRPTPLDVGEGLFPFFPFNFRKLAILGHLRFGFRAGGGGGS